MQLQWRSASLTEDPGIEIKCVGLSGSRVDGLGKDVAFRVVSDIECSRISGRSRALVQRPNIHIAGCHPTGNGAGSVKRSFFEIAVNDEVLGNQVLAVEKNGG